MSKHDYWESLVFWIKQNWGLLATWLGTVTLAHVQAVVGILSGLAVLVYTVMKTIKLKREMKQ